MNSKRDIAYCCFVIMICALLLYWLRNAGDDAFRLLLYPHAKLTEIYHNMPFIYVKGIGYSSIDGTFAIGRECMGSNFIIMLFGMTACTFGRHFKGVKKAVWLLSSLAASIVIGVLVSCIRIIGSVPFVTNPKFALLHSGIGISLYFFTLTACYAVLIKLFRGDRSEKII